MWRWYEEPCERCGVKLARLHCSVSKVDAVVPCVQVQNRIKQLVASSNGEVRFEHFDSAVCSALAKIPVPSALSAIDSVEKADKRSIPSLQAFLLSTIQQY